VQRTGVQRLAFLSLVLLTLLILAGAVVRVTGSGLGCPDWPTCWGKLIPPTKLEQVDFEKLNVERFKRSAKRFGRDPEEVTEERLKAEFNPMNVWIEFLNRLLALPMLAAVLALAGVAVFKKGTAPLIRKLSVGSLLVTVANALFGIVVVASGLHTGVVTVHMALAFLLLFFLVYIIWAGGTGKPQRIPGPGRKSVFLLMACVMVEWAMGSQVRELTDHLQMENGVASRPQWIDQIRDSWWFLIHRSFSWSILLVALYLGWKCQWQGRIPRLVLAVVFVLMIMGIILSYAGIHAVTQVLHVGLAAVLISATFYWWLAAGKEGEGA